MLRESVSREIPDARGEQGARTVNLLKSRCRVSARRASADVENAKLTCPDTGTLRELGAALAAGEVSREHVDVGRSDAEAAAGAGGAGAAGRGRPAADRARPRVRPGRCGLLAQAPAVGAHPGPGGPVRRERPGPAAPVGRDRPDRDGPAQRPARPGRRATVATVLDHFVEKDRAAGGADGAEVDLRTRGQRRADASVQMADAAASRPRRRHDG